jgi:hypothetical protein
VSNDDQKYNKPQSIDDFIWTEEELRDDPLREPANSGSLAIILGLLSLVFWVVGIIWLAERVIEGYLK